MPRSPARELDLRYWIPLLSLGIFIVATLVWTTLGYYTYIGNIRTRAVADWRDRLSRMQDLLEASVSSPGGGQMTDRAFASFNSVRGLRALVLVDRAGTIVRADRRELLGRSAGETLAGFDTQMLAPQHLTRHTARIGLDDDDHVRGYYPLTLAPAEQTIRPPADALLYLDFDTAAVIASLYANLEAQTGIFAIIVFVGLLGGVLFTRRHVNRPIDILTRAVLEFHPGKPFVPIPLVGNGPLSRLAREFERGAQTLNRTIAEAESRGERLDRILESIGDGVIITDAEGRVERLNPVAEALTGWPRAQAAGRHVTDIFAPFSALDREPLPNPALQALETGKVIGLANHAAIRSRSGQIYQIADTAAPVRNTDGMTEGTVLVFQDVTEAYGLREEQRIASVAFDTGAPQLIADRDGKIIRVNQAGLALGGFAEQELLGANLVGSVFVGQDSPGLREFYAGEVDSWSGPTWWLGKDGKRLDMWVRNTILRDDQGRIAHYVITGIDATELTRTTTALGETRENYQQLIGAIHDGVAIIQDQTFVDCNDPLAEILGRPRAGILGRTVTDLSLPQQASGGDSTTLSLALFAEVMAKGDAHIDWHLVRANGRPVLLEATLSRILWQGEPAVLAVARDITERHEHDTERRRLLAALERSERMMRLACSVYGIAPWELDVTSGELRWAPGAESVLGVHREDLPPSEEAALQSLPPEQQEHQAAAFREALLTSQPFHFEFATNVSGRGLRWLRNQGEHRLNPDGRRFLHGAIADITEQRQAQQNIEQLAFHDSLTGLANRRLFLDRLAHASRQVQRSGLGGAVLFVDLDRFKLLNDSLGHAAGDALLREVARRCEDAVREADTVARLGGDEFVILVTELGDDEDQVASNAEQVATKLRARLDTAYPLGEHAYHLSASIGIALFPRDGDNAEELLRHADVAMYQVKQRGRNAVAFYQPGLQDRADQRLILERELRLAIDRDELLLYYQPKVDCSGRVIGAEALLRWQHPVRGLVSPLDFIPIAEDTGLIYPIGKQVMRQACAQLQRWQIRCPDRHLNLAVNVSPHQFRHPDFLPCVTSAVQDFDVRRDRLIVEITEGTMLDSIDLVIARMQELKALGLGLAVDDFGTGYSSLYYLKNLPLDEIKIDQSYVRDLLDDANDAAIVESIIAIAHNLRLRTVAEGVETAAQRDKLWALGCLVHQGYFYARPMPLAEFETFAGIV